MKFSLGGFGVETSPVVLLVCFVGVLLCFRFFVVRSFLAGGEGSSVCKFAESLVCCGVDVVCSAVLALASAC